MKRYGNLWPQIVDLDNILIAHSNARKGKRKYKSVQKIDENPEKYCKQIQEMLISKTFTTSEYETFIKKDKGKLREISKLPYYPDRIVQHAIMQVLEPIWKSTLIADTYQSIKGRGVHKVLPKVVKAIQQDDIEFCLKLDVKKFYPSIDKRIMKSTIRNKIKCKDTLWLLDNIIDSSTTGLPIGNYISQYFGNLYLSALDHYVKEVIKASHYYRYCDDIIILSDSKSDLHSIRHMIQDKLTSINLTLKHDYRVYPTTVGVDTLGYIVSKRKVKVRSNIKRNMLRTYTSSNASSYNGVLKHCDGHILSLRLKGINK